MAYRADALDEPGRQREANEVEELAVAVLLDDVDVVVTLDERCDLVGERQRADAQVVDRFAGCGQRLPSFDDGGMGRAERDQPDP